MDATLQLSAAPATTARVCASNRFGRARLTPDAGVAFIVEREARNVMLARIGLDAVPGPVCQNAYLLHLLSARQTVILEFLQVCTGGRLLAAQAGEPPGEGLQRPHQWLNLANLTTLGWVDDVQ